VSDLSKFFEHFGHVTIRDLTAIIAMHAMVSSLRSDEELYTEGTAEWAYQMADAMASAKVLETAEEEEIEEVDETEGEENDF